jgi:AraC-like DNA-binding protein
MLKPISTPALSPLFGPASARGPIDGAEGHDGAAPSQGEQESARWGTLGEPAANADLARLAHLVETPAATLRHGFYQEGCCIPLHRHECDVLVYGVGGPCVEFAGSGQIVKRRLTFHPRGYEHALRFEGPTHVLAIEIPLTSESWASASTPLPATFYTLVWRALLQIAERRPIEAISSALQELLDAAGDYMARTRPEWLMNVVDHIHGHWREIQSVNVLAAMFGVSPQHLCRAFKQHLGVTIGQYSLALRIDYARGLLWGTGMPICEVAAETGFADQAHLTRVLGDHVAKTPARLRWKAPCLNMRQPMPAIR